jgi:hypothetical protein
VIRGPKPDALEGARDPASLGLNDVLRGGVDLLALLATLEGLPAGLKVGAILTIKDCYYWDEIIPMVCIGGELDLARNGAL